MTDSKAKMHQIRFRLGLRPRFCWGELTALPRPLAGFGGRFVAGERLGWGRGRKGEGKGRDGEVDGREREGPQVTVEPGPLRALLRH